MNVTAAAGLARLPGNNSGVANIMSEFNFVGSKTTQHAYVPLQPAAASKKPKLDVKGSAATAKATMRDNTNAVSRNLQQIKSATIGAAGLQEANMFPGRFQHTTNNSSTAVYFVHEQ